MSPKDQQRHFHEIYTQTSVHGRIDSDVGVRREVPTRERQTNCSERNSCKTLCRCSPPFKPSSFVMFNAWLFWSAAAHRRRRKNEPLKAQPTSTNRNYRSYPSPPLRPSFDVVDCSIHPARTTAHSRASELHQPYQSALIK